MILAVQLAILSPACAQGIHVNVVPSDPAALTVTAGAATRGQGVQGLAAPISFDGLCLDGALKGVVPPAPLISGSNPILALPDGAVKAKTVPEAVAVTGGATAAGHELPATWKDNGQEPGADVSQKKSGFVQLQKQLELLTRRTANAVSPVADLEALEAGNAVFDNARIPSGAREETSDDGASSESNLRISPPRPRYLYHIAPASSWRKIQSTGGIEPRVDRNGDDALNGIFSLEMENLRRNWIKSPGREGFGFKRTGLATLVWYMLLKLGAHHGHNPPGHQKLVVLKIQVAPEDELFVRDNRFVLGEKSNDEEFRASLTRADSIPREQFENGLLEFIVANPIPLDRITVLSTVRVDGLPKYRDIVKGRTAPDALFHLFFPGQNLTVSP